MVVAEHPPAPGEGVLVQLAGLLVLAQREQVDGEVAGRGEGVGVVVAEHPPAAGEGVLVQVAGLLVLAQRGQVGARLLAEARVSGWSSPSWARRMAWARWNSGSAARAWPRVCR